MSVGSARPARGPTRWCFETADPDQAHELLRDTYVEAKPRLLAHHDDYLLRHTSIDAGCFSVGLAAHNGRVSLRTTPVERVIVGQVLMLDGEFSLRNSRDEFVAALGDVFLLVPDLPNVVNYDSHRTGTVSFDLSYLDRIASGLTGSEPGSLRFDRYRPFTPQLAEYWRATVRHVTGALLTNDAVMSNPISRNETARMLATAILTAFPNTAMTAARDRHRGAGAAEPPVVRRAVEYIDANAHAPIDIGDIAAAAGVGPRSLQQAFRRHRDTTPLAHLHRVRLERAHRDLLAADPTRGDTVAAIASRWGFAHHGRFAAQYRRAYGRPPSRTLRT